MTMLKTHHGALRWALAAILLLASGQARAAPSVCDAPERTSAEIKGIYGGNWSGHGALPAGSLLACRSLVNLFGTPELPPNLAGKASRAIAVRYVTTNAAGQRVPATGLLLVPTRVPPENGAVAPLIAIATGTVGVADHCAPSVTLRQGTSIVGPATAYYLAKGMTVLIVDYIGLGTQLGDPQGGDDHPYLEGPSAAHVLLDALRAARQVPGGRFDRQDGTIPTAWPLAISGYSQGGTASLWAASLAPAYAPELPLRAAVVGGPAVDLPKLLDKLGGSLGSALVGTFLLGASNATAPGTRVSDIEEHLTDDGRNLLELARQNCASDVAFLTLLDRLLGRYTIDQLVDDSLYDDPQYLEWTRLNSMTTSGRPAPRAATLVFHSDGDDIVPYEPSRAMFEGDGWNYARGSHLLGGELDVARAAMAFQPVLGAVHLLAPPVEFYDGWEGLRYSPFEWLWDGLFAAPRSDPDRSR